LGHVVSKECITINLEKIRFVMEWIDPRNVDEVRSFMEVHQELLIDYLPYYIISKER